MDGRFFRHDHRQHAGYTARTPSRAGELSKRSDPDSSGTGRRYVLSRMAELFGQRSAARNHSFAPPEPQRTAIGSDVFSQDQSTGNYQSREWPDCRPVPDPSPWGLNSRLGDTSN